MLRCLICGKEIPEGEMIDDCIAIRGILEDGTWWDGYGFICTLDCFLEFKKRVFKDRKGKNLVFIINK